jgi:hypothetical protein
MSETRRQLFKTSILSAFGLTACASTLEKTTVIGPDAADPQSVGMIVKTSGGWIYLDPQFGLSGNLLDYYLAYNFVPTGSGIDNFDIGTVAKSLKSSDLIGTKSVTIVGSGKTLSIQGGQVYLPPGLHQLTWNEIGSNTF